MLWIEFSKQSDGAVVLRCTRADGSTTWQKQTRHAAHFILHDLTHYAVETTLETRQGFFGLIASGWDIDETTGEGPRGSIPLEALAVEKLVGLFDCERGSDVRWSAEEINQFAPRPLTQGEITRIFEFRSSLFAQWFALEPGGKLELAMRRS